MTHKSNKLRCDVCGKRREALGGYGEHAPPGWWICLKCFAKAEAIAKREDRWPEPRDFECERASMKK